MTSSDNPSPQMQSKNPGKSTLQLSKPSPSNPSRRRTLSGQLGKNLKSKWGTWVGALVTVGATVGSYFYVDTVLISEAPPPPGLLFEPGRTVLTVNIFAHIVAFLVLHQVSSTMETVRWALASRGDGADTGERAGISFASFLSLSRATPPSGVATLLLLPKRGWHVLWGLKR